MSVEKQQDEIARVRARLDAWLEQDVGASARRYVRGLVLLIGAGHRLKLARPEIERRLAEDSGSLALDRLVMEEVALDRTRQDPRSSLDVWLAEHDDGDRPLGRRYLRALADSAPGLWDIVDARAGDWVDLRPFGTRKPPTRINAAPGTGAFEPDARLLARVVPMPYGAELGAGSLTLSPRIALRRGAPGRDLVDDVFARWVEHRLRDGSSGRKPDGATAPSERTRVLERVKKLYAMAQETEASPHEAEIALRRCQSLMAKFGISETDLETSAFGTAASPRRTVAMHVRYLGSAVALLHDVLFVTGGLEGVEFRGYEIDVDVARMTFEYLENAVERALTARRRAGDFPAGRSAAYDYRIGFAAEVCKRVEAMVSERERAERTASSTGTALTVRKREIVDRECGAELRTTRSTHRGVRDRGAADAGRADGAQVSLDPQVGSGRGAARLGRD